MVDGLVQGHRRRGDTEEPAGEEKNGLLKCRCRVCRHLPKVASEIWERGVFDRVLYCLVHMDFHPRNLLVNSYGCCSSPDHHLGLGWCLFRTCAYDVRAPEWLWSPPAQGLEEIPAAEGEVDPASKLITTPT